MNFQNSLFLIPAISGFVFIVVGFIMSRFPPKKINIFYGYRSPGAMKSQERWDFAQIYAARDMMKFGSVLIVSSVLGLFIDLQKEVELILGLAFLLLMVVLLIIRTENALDHKFKENKE